MPKLLGKGYEGKVHKINYLVVRKTWYTCERATGEKIIDSFFSVKKAVKKLPKHVKRKIKVPKLFAYLDHNGLHFYTNNKKIRNIIKLDLVQYPELKTKALTYTQYIKADSADIYSVEFYRFSKVLKQFQIEDVYGDGNIRKKDNMFYLIDVFVSEKMTI